MKDYVTPFSIDFTKVKVESIDITHSIIYGRKFNREIDYIIVNKIQINDTGFRHVYSNKCIMLL